MVKPVIEFPNYDVSEAGVITNRITGKALTPHDNGLGYATVSLCRDGKTFSRSLARIVAEAYIPCDDPRRMVASYKDGDKTNCTADNLEWRTPSAAVLDGKDKRRVGRSGERHIYYIGKKYRVIVQRNGFKRAMSFDTMGEAKAYRREILGY